MFGYRSKMMCEIATKISALTNHLSIACSLDSIDDHVVYIRRTKLHMVDRVYLALCPEI